MRSLIVLKGLTYAPTGGLVAAATTSLPEQIGGPRNWDYRYCWLRDATFALLSLLRAGYRRGSSRHGANGCCELSPGALPKCRSCTVLAANAGSTEVEIPWLSGYENSVPVRIGNAASTQFQLDVYGEVLATMFEADRAGIKMQEPDWALMVHLMKFLESNWQKPDEGIWEVRGGRKNFTHSKMMAWVAFDCAIKLVEECGCAAGEPSCSLAKSQGANSRRGLRARLQLREKGVHPVLRFRCAGRQPADDATRWLSACNRRTRPQYCRGHRTRADGRWLGAALSTAGMRRGRIAGARRCFSPVFFLVGRLLAPPRSKERSARIVRALA